MTFAIALLLGLLVIALVFFAFEWIPSDVVALGLLLSLILSGLLPAKTAFAGFGSDTVIMILGLLIMTTALVRTGVVDLIAQTILRHTGARVPTLLATVMGTVASLSAFISNTAAAALFLPVVTGLAAKAKISPSRLLMPVAFASILTSSVTLISTSTNLVVSGLMARAGLEPLGMFELAPVGLPIAIVGLLYMFFIGRRLIPDRANPAELVEQFELRHYITEVIVLDDSPLLGKTLAKADLGRELDLEVVRVLRKPNRFLWPRRDLKLEAGDVLLMKGARKDVLKVKDTAGLEIRPDVELSDPDLRDEDTRLVEALVVPRSRLIGRTLSRVGVRERYGVQVLGLNRHGRNVPGKLGHTVFHAGDVLLLQGRAGAITGLAEDGIVSILNAVEERRIDRGRAGLSMLIFAGSLALAATNMVALPVAVLLGAFAVLATRCIPPADAYREVEWRAVILIACMLAVGEAMMTTGTASYLANHVSALTAGLSPLALLGGFFIFTVVLTQPMSNQAAAAVLLPIAVETATRSGFEPRPFALMIAIAASCSYLTPLEPACLMVYGPGRYRFIDFVRVGGLLTVLIFALALWLVPWFWPIQSIPGR